jgi:hypothetical protein
MWTIRRDYRDLVPLLRHRHEPDHPAVVALRRQAHDVRLTLDAGFQFRVTSIVASYARKSSGRAAAIVLDPDSGELLASASYPWPEVEAPDGDADKGEAGSDVLLDRARYGLYPPGSTFKLVTAAAALRHGVDPAATTFACTRLPDGRVGAKVNGWNRPIRDDVLDTHPHGTIGMHDGLVHSCNAYFAQLALSLGAEPLVSTAARLGIALTPSKTSAQRVRETLPQIGYGQGDVVATPMRMARVAAAIASDGVLRETHQEQGAPGSGEPDLFLNRDASRLGRLHARRRPHGYGAKPEGPPLANRWEDGDCGTDGTCIACLVRRLRALRHGHQTDRLRHHHRERRLWRRQRRAGRRRHRHGRRAERARPVKRTNQRR